MIGVGELLDVGRDDGRAVRLVLIMRTVGCRIGALPQRSTFAESSPAARRVTYGTG